MGRKRIWEDFGMFETGKPQYRKYTNHPKPVFKFKTEKAMREQLSKEWPDHKFRIKGYKNPKTNKENPRRYIQWAWKYLLRRGGN